MTFLEVLSVVLVCTIVGFALGAVAGWVMCALRDTDPLTAPDLPCDGPSTHDVRTFEDLVEMRRQHRIESAKRNLALAATATCAHPAERVFFDARADEFVCGVCRAREPRIYAEQRAARLRGA